MSGTAAKSLERRLWLPIVVPSGAWITAFTVGYVLASEVCASGGRWVLYLVNGSAFAAAAFGAFEGWRAWRRLDRGGGEEVGARRRFMAVAGMILAVYFCLAILALSIPQIVHRPCD